MESLPFYINNVYNGLGKTEGTARCDEDTLILEFQTQDSFFGLLKSEVKTIPLPMHELAEVNLRRKILSAVVTLRAHSMRVWEAFPESSQGEIRLRVARKHRKAAEDFVTELELRRAESQLRQLDEEAMRNHVRRLNDLVGEDKGSQ